MTSPTFQARPGATVASVAAAVASSWSGSAETRLSAAAVPSGVWVSSHPFRCCAATERKHLLVSAPRAGYAAGTTPRSLAMSLRVTLIQLVGLLNVVFGGLYVALGLWILLAGAEAVVGTMQA